MASYILRDIAKSIQQAKYFAMMTDKVSDSSIREHFISFGGLMKFFNPMKTSLALAMLHP